MKYAVITNPNRLLLKHEVWFYGEAEVQNEKGYMEVKHVTRMVKAFPSQDKAQGYIDYQTAVRKFKEQ